ncbi:MAG: TRAP transporter large permease [Moorellales bacterium]
MSPELTGVLGFVVLLVLILVLRFPIAFALLIVGVAGYAYLGSPQAALMKLGTDVFGTAKGYSLSVIPMFVLMGLFLSSAGVGKDLFRAFNAWFGHIRGGLAVATVVACTAFAAVCGSSIASAATMATVAVPPMLAHKYREDYAAGTVASASTLGILIPPSTVMVIYGVITQEPIGKLLIAEIIPGLIAAVLLALVAWGWAKVNPKLAPEAYRATREEKLEALNTVWPVPAIFLLMMGGIYAGVFTPTEAGAMGAFLSLLYCLLTRRMSWPRFFEAVRETVKVVAMLMLVVIGGVIFGHFMSISHLPLLLKEALAGVSPTLLLVLVFIIYFAAGFVMDEMAILIIFTNLFYPLLTGAGYSGIWFGVISILFALLAFLTPPVGIVALVTAGITKIKSETVFRGTVPYWLALIAATILVMVFPRLATFLPSLMR